MVSILVTVLVLTPLAFDNVHFVSRVVWIPALIYVTSARLVVFEVHFRVAPVILLASFVLLFSLYCCYPSVLGSLFVFLFYGFSVVLPSMLPASCMFRPLGDSVFIVISAGAANFPSFVTICFGRRCCVCVWCILFVFCDVFSFSFDTVLRGPFSLIVVLVSC